MGEANGLLLQGATAPGDRRLREHRIDVKGRRNDYPAAEAGVEKGTKARDISGIENSEPR